MILTKYEWIVDWKDMKISMRLGLTGKIKAIPNGIITEIREFKIMKYKLKKPIPTNTKELLIFFSFCLKCVRIRREYPNTIKM